MKPLQGDSVNINSCTCTSCDAKSESDRQTLKRLLNQGSKINKLLTGKYYVHLRESDILDKLIKTRALYESLRSQLLSSSESSSADLQSQQSSRELRKAFLEAKKSSDIFAFVDLVDMGAIMGLRKLSECCSCCTCSSKLRLHENAQKGRRNRQAYPGGIIASRSILVSKQETGVAKNIKSDPCTRVCFKKGYNMKSQELAEKVRPRKSIIERDCLPATSNNLKLTTLNNSKLERRKSYHQLKRVKVCPSPYMEHIGEGGNKALRKSKLVNHTIERTISIEAAQKKIKDSFETDRKVLRKKEPVENSKIKENMSRAIKTTTIKLKDNVDRKRQAQSSELKQSFAHKSRKNNQTLAENTNISETSNTSSTTTLKEIPYTKGNERKERHSQGEKRKIMHTLAETNTEISYKFRVDEESHALKGSNQVQNSKTSKFPPQKDTAYIIKKHEKLLPFSCTPGKDLSIPNTATVPDIQNPESISSIKKSQATNHKKLSSNSNKKINKSNLRTRSFVSFRKRLILLSGPLRLRPRLQISEEPRHLEEPARHKKPRYSEELYPCKQCLQEAACLRKELRRRQKSSEVNQNKIKPGSHGLKRCICSIKFKINETKCRISKNVTNENLKVKDKQIIHSKSLLSSEKTLKIANDDPKHMSDHAIKCESSGYVKQTQAIRKIKQVTQNETNAHVEIKRVNENQSIHHNLAQDISTTAHQSIHALISDYRCKEVEQFMYKHYGKQNIKFGGKSTFNHYFSNKPKEKFKMQDEHAVIDYSNRITSKCECFDENIVSEEMERIKIKSTLKDVSITTEKPRNLHHQSVQTVIKLTQQEKQNTYACNPRFSMEMNKGYFKNGLKISQSKVKFKCCEGTKQLPNKQSQKSTKTTAKHGLRRCFCTLQLDKQENKIKSQRKLSKVTIIQPKSQVKAYQTELNLARHVILPYEDDLTISSSKKCFSRQLKVELIKKEERKSEIHITPSVRKSRSYSSLNSRSLQIPKTENIHSIVISYNSEILTTILKRNKIKSPDFSKHRVRACFSRKIFNSKRSSWLCSPIDKDDKIIKEDTIICSLKDIKLKNDMRGLQKIIPFENTTKEDQILLLDLTNKRCLPTLKLRKIGTYNKKSSLVNTDIKSNIIIIADKIRPGFHKGAKFTTSKYSNQLSNCKCNPGEYLEKNKRNRTLKQFGILTKKDKNKSKSRHTLRRKLLFVKSDFLQGNPSLPRFKKMRINSESPYLPQYNDIFMKQGVKIGSNFSFDINFYKGVTAENYVIQNSTNNMNVNFVNNTQGSNLPTKRYSSNRITHIRNTKVSPESNKCFCKLKISKTDEQRRNSKMLSPFVTKKLTQVYAVNTVAMAMPENKIKTPETIKGDHDCHYMDSHHTIKYSKNASSHIKQWQYFNKNPARGFSLSMIAFNAKNIQSCKHDSKYKLLQIRSTEQSLFDFASNEAKIESAFSCEMDDLKNIYKKNRIIGSAQSQNDSPLLSQHNPSTNTSLLTGAQPLLRRCYCTMNIQVARHKRKLLDYECEPGICIPGECDPYECQKLIMKRLMRKVSKMSGTDSRSRSSASGTSSTSSRSKRLQSGVAREPKYRTRGHSARLKSTPPRQGLKYQTLPRGSAPARRQAVKVSSTFSFDIEFSKGITKSSAAPTTETVVKVPKRHTFSRSSITYHRRGMDRGTKYSGGRHHRETQSMMKQMRHTASSVTPMLKRCFCTLKLQKKGRQQKEFELRSITQGTSTPPKLGDEGPVFITSEKGQNTRKHKCGPTCDECDPSDCLELIKKRNKHTKDFGTDSMVSSTSSSSMTSSQKRKMKRIQARNIRPKQFRSSYTSVRSNPSVISIDTVNRQGQDRQVAKPSRQAVKIGSTFSFNIEFYKDKTSPYNDSDRQPPEVFVHKAPKEVKRVPKNVYAQRRMREGSSQSATSSRDDDSQIGMFQRGQSTMTSEFYKRNAKLQGYNVDAATGARRPPSKLKRCFCTLKLLSGSKRHRINDGGVGHERATSVAMTQTRRTRVLPQTKGRLSGLLPYECEPGVCEPGNCDPYECIKLIRKRIAKEKMTGTEGPRTRSTSSYFTSSNPSRARMTQYRSAYPKTKMTQLRPGRRRARGRRRDYASRESVLEEKIVMPVPPQRQAVKIGSNFSFNIEFYKDKSPNNFEVQVAAPVVKRFRPVSMRDRGHGSYRRIRTRDRGLRGRRFPSISRDSQMDRIKSRDIGFGPILRRCFCTLKLQKPKAKSKAVSKTKTKTKTAESVVKSKAVSKADIKAETDTKTIQKQTDNQTQKNTIPNLKCLCDKANKNKCLCDQPNKKNKCICDKPNKKNECTCTGPIKEVATLHNKSVVASEKTKKSILASKKTKESIIAAIKPKESIVAAIKPKESIIAAIKPKRNIMKRRKAFPYKLEPYECEPGICVPGECDPWECLKLINKRLMYSSGTSTDQRGTRSTSIMAVSTIQDSEVQSYIQRKKQMRTRDTYTRFRSAWPKTKMTQSRSARRRVRGRRRNYALSDSILQEKFVVPASPQRQAVRIGSNFSLSIEFYKDKSPNNLKVPVATPVVKRYQPVSMRDRGHGAYRRVRTRDRRLRGRRFPSISRDSQMDRIKSRDIGLGPILKRCFCTLKLQKSKAKYKTVSKTKTETKPAESVVKSKAVSKTKTETKTAEAVVKSKAVSKADIKAETDTKTIQKQSDSQTQKNTIPNPNCLCDKTNKKKCICYQPNKKNKCICDQPNKKNECTCTPSIKEVATLHNKSITTLEKTKESIVKPEETKEIIVASKKTKESIVVAIKPKRNIMKRRQAFPYKLEPYECEPGICVPGECDPYDCLKLINKRLMYSSGTLTDARGTRSTSNMAVSSYRDSEAQSYMHRKKLMKTRDAYTRYREKKPYGERRSHTDRWPHRERRLHREKIPHRERTPHRERRPESRSYVVEKPTKQAVKIGSTFDFEVEFSKDKLLSGPVVTSKPIIQYSKPKKTSSRATEGHSISYRNKKAHRHRANRDIHSQALGPSMRSAMTGTVGPFLKRCFCTLQLRCNTENHESPFECVSDLKTRRLKSPEKSQAIQFTICSADKNKQARKQAAFYESSKLLPYECEPGFCVPGECDPYECMKRIKRRMQSKQVGTIYSNRSFSSSTYEGRKYRPRSIQTRSSTPRRRNVMTSRYSNASIRSVSSSSDERKYRHQRKARSFSPRRRKVKSGMRNDDQFQHDTSSYRQAGVKYDNKPKRQAVRMGSSFNFDIEFFKENSSKITRDPQVNNIVKKDERKRWSTRRGRVKRSISTNSMSSDERHYLIKKRAKKGTMTRSISNKSMSSYGIKYNPRDIQSQSEVKKTYSKGIGTPLFRRCFCTLKLEKKGRLRQPKPKKKFSSNIIKACRRAPSFKSPSEKAEPSTKCVSTLTKIKTKEEFIRKLTPPSFTCKPSTVKTTNDFPCKKGKECKCCKCTTNFMKPNEYRRKKECCKCLVINTPALEPSEFPCKKGKKCKCCKCNTSREQDQKCCNCNAPGLESNEQKIVPVDKCKCKTQKLNKKNKKYKNCKCFESCECVGPPLPSFKCLSKKPSRQQDQKCCKCNTPALEKSEFPCKKGKKCKCCKCNTSREQDQKCCNCNAPGLGSNEQKIVPVDKCKCKTQKPNKNKTKNKICKCFESCECIGPPLPSFKCVPTHTNLKTKSVSLFKRLTSRVTRDGPPNEIRNTSREQDQKCCKCNTPMMELNEFPCKKGKKCNCCKCNTSREQDQKCCKCKSPGLEPNEFPCKKGKECKCCKCNTHFMRPNEQKIDPVVKCRCKKQKPDKKNTKNKICKCESHEYVATPFPCKEGKECKCCICNTCFTITNEYQYKNSELYKSSVGNTGQKINPLDGCKCKTQKPNKNKKCCESCECKIQNLEPKVRSPFTCKTSTVKMSDKKTLTKTKYDPLKQLDLPEECGLCKTPYECRNGGIRRMNRSPDKRMKRRPRMSASSIAATFVPGYTHKRVKYKGEPYYPDKIERIVEEPRYPFLQGKDARQGVKISSNFSFNVEFFKEMLPPAMDTDNEMDEGGEAPPSHRNYSTQKSIKEIHRATDIRNARHGKRDDYKYSNDSQSESDRKSSPYKMLRKCFCQTKLQKCNRAESMTVSRGQESLPVSLFEPVEFLVQYQIQQPTRKYFKSNPQELETIMCYAASKSNNNFGRVDPTKQGTQGIPKYSEPKKSTLKNMLMYCKTLFTKRSNKHNTQKPEGWTELKREATNKQPVIDILKASKSERHPNKVNTADIKISKSLKVGKISENKDYKKKYSLYQSGDHHGSKSQYTPIKFVKKKCRHCQNKQTIPIHDMIRFTTLRTAKALNSKQPDDFLVTDRRRLENDPESVSFMFKSPKFKNSWDVHLKMCSCCGGIRRIKKKPSASNLLNMKDKILECIEDTTTTVMPKALIAIATKMDTPEEATLLQENKQDCRCCVCKSISKSKFLEGKKSAFSVCGNVVWKNEPERRTESMYYAEFIKNTTTICPAKSEKKAFATGSGYKLAPDKEESYSKLVQEAKLKEVIDNNINEKDESKRHAICKNNLGALLVDNKVGLTSTVEILRNLHITVSDPKGASRKFQSYLCDHMQACKKFQRAAYNGIGVETLHRLKLKCQASKCVKESKEKIGDHLEPNFAIPSKNTNLIKECHSKKPAWHRHSESVFEWSPFMLSLRKTPWLSAYYKCAGFFPHCLTILQVWRQFMDIILFILAVTAVSPCLLGTELCRALKSCFLCTT